MARTEQGLKGRARHGQQVAGVWPLPMTSSVPGPGSPDSARSRARWGRRPGSPEQQTPEVLALAEVLPQREASTSEANHGCDRSPVSKTVRPAVKQASGPIAGCSTYMSNRKVLIATPW